MYEADSAEAGARASGSGRPLYLAWLLWVIWLPFLIPVLGDFSQSHPTPLRVVVSLLALAIFVALYLWLTWHNARDLTRTLPAALVERSLVALWSPVIILLALSVALTLANGWAWGALFIFTSSAAAGRLRARQTIVVLVVLALLVVEGGWHTHRAAADVVQALLLIGIVGIAVLSLVQSAKVSLGLRATQAEMARSNAVSAERLRIARDLHDLLGHNLSLIALKSELAGRLLRVAPDRAAVEIGDIERVARTALQEVREAVTGYRQATLASELHGARELLAAAGIEYQHTGDRGITGALPTPADALLAWAVREAITNVIRHSRARHCAIHLSQADGWARLEVTDDGPGAAADPSRPTTGAIADRGWNGLRGLAERVDALGGRFAAGPRPTGGFCLAVSVPTTPATRDDAAPSSSTPSPASPAVPASPAHAGDASERGVAR